VEEKGYKRIMNLSDQVGIDYIFIKSKKRYEIARNYLSQKCPVYLKAMVETIMILKALTFTRGV